MDILSLLKKYNLKLVNTIDDYIVIDTQNNMLLLIYDTYVIEKIVIQYENGTPLVSTGKTFYYTDMISLENILKKYQK